MSRENLKKAVYSLRGAIDRVGQARDHLDHAGREPFGESKIWEVSQALAYISSAEFDIKDARVYMDRAEVKR